MIVAIKQDDLHKWWPLVRQFIEKSLSKGYGEYDTEDIHTLLEDGNAGLILAIVDGEVVAGMVTTIVQKPAIREMIMMTGGGEYLDKWMPEFYDEMVKLAKTCQADVISIHGRRGWVKKLQAYGFEEVHTTVIKRI